MITIIMSYNDELYPDDLLWDTVLHIIRENFGEYEDIYGWDSDISALNRALPNVKTISPQTPCIYGKLELHFPSDEAEFTFRLRYL